MNLLGGAGAADRVADDPAHGIASGDGASADEGFSRLQRYVGDLADGGIDLIEGAARIGVDLHGVDEAVAHRLDAGGRIGLIDAGGGVHRFRRAARFLDRLHLAGKRQGARQFDDGDGSRRFDRLHGGGRVVIADLGGLLHGGATGQRGRRQHHRQDCGFTEKRNTGFAEH